MNCPDGVIAVVSVTVYTGVLELLEDIEEDLVLTAVADEVAV